MWDRDALIPAIYAGRIAGETGVPVVAAAVRSVAPSIEPQSATDELHDAAALLIDAGWIFLACRLAQYVWDDAA